MRKLGWFGGSFNPVHCGHIAMAEKLLALLDVIYLLPTSRNIGKQVIEAQHRLEMLKLAINKVDRRILIDDREIVASKTTYTIDTLKQIRQDNRHDQINFILGADSLEKIGSWKDYQQLTNYANLMVLERKGIPRAQLQSQLANWTTAKIVDKQQWCKRRHSSIYFCNTGTIGYSSTSIRTALSKGEEIEQGSLEDSVLSYIQQEKLYQS